MEFILDEVEVQAQNTYSCGDEELPLDERSGESFMHDSPISSCTPPPNPYLEEDKWKLYMKAKKDKEKIEQLYQEREGDLNMPTQCRPPPPSQILYDVKTHWQCLYCDKILSKKTRKMQHERTCSKKRNVSDILKDILVVDGNVIDNTKKNDHVNCYICKASISKTNISRHINAVHRRKNKLPQSSSNTNDIQPQPCRVGRPRILNIACTMCTEMLSKTGLTEHYFRKHNSAVPVTENGNKGKQKSHKGTAKGLFFATSKYHLKHYMCRVLEGRIPLRTVRIKRMVRFRRKTICLVCNTRCTSHATLRAHYRRQHKDSSGGSGVFPNYRLTFSYCKIRPRLSRTTCKFSTIEKRKLLIQSSTLLSYKNHDLRGYRQHLVFKGPGLKMNVNENDNVSEWNIQMRSRTVIIKQYAGGNEIGIGNYHHCHIFFKTANVNMKVESMRRFIKRRNRFLTEISAGKSEEKVVKYVTKEDIHAVVLNIDKEVCHRRWQFNHIFENTDCINKTSYKAMKWDSKFTKDEFISFIESKRDEFFKVESLKRCRLHLNSFLLDAMNACTKKGIWIVGPPGVGKSSTVMCYTNGKYFELAEKINNFMFDGWNGEDIIVAEDVTVAWAQNIRRTINNLTDDRGLCIGEHKGRNKFNVCVRKLICTSNEGPPVWEGFARRFDVLMVSPST